MMKKKVVIPMAALGLAAAFAAGPISNIVAYQTDRPQVMENNFTIALDPVVHPTEDFSREERPDIEGPVMSFSKVVQLTNTGYLDAYGRVKLTFEDSEIEKRSQFSPDGVNYYSVADYKNHLPAGWTYNESDGYYYYTPVLVAEGWEDLQKKLEYDNERGGYFYNAANRGNVISGKCISVPLIQKVKTVFDSPSQIRGYSIMISSDSTAAYWGNNYKEAWDAFLSLKGK